MALSARRASPDDGESQDDGEPPDDGRRVSPACGSNAWGRIKDGERGPSRKKGKIPKSVTDAAWQDRFGLRGSAKCPVCDINTITMSSFHAGHVVAEVNGGRADLGNLVPIYSSCNIGMATRDMREYQQEHYPDAPPVLEE